MLFGKKYRSFVKSLVILIGVVLSILILYVASQLILSKVLPESKLVSCRFLNYKQCENRDDCYGITLGGLGIKSEASHGCFSVSDK